MTLFTMLVSFLKSKCINVVAKPDFIESHKSQLVMIPVNIKNVLLTVLCKRSFIKDAYILKQLVNSKVTVMDLSECEVSNDMLICLYVCKYLKKLDLSLRRRQTRCITSKVLNSLLEHLHYLKILAIPHCKEVNDEVIKTLCESCKELEELHIPNSSITNHSLFLIGQALKNLFVINILGTQISDGGIEDLISGSLSETLSEINIDKCTNVSPHSSAVIAEKCNNIKIFSCGSCGSYEESSGAMNGIRLKAKQIFWSV